MMKPRLGVALAAALLLGGSACLGLDGQDDTEPPSVAFVTPNNGEVVSGEVQVEVLATDDTGIVLVRLFRANDLAAELTAPPYRVTWNTTLLANAEIQWTAQAIDLVGNMASATITVTVQNPDP